MERFDASHLCPRCESRAASYKLHTTACPDIEADGEHMHRQCPACGHEWAEATRSPLHSSGASAEAESLDLTGLEEETTVEIPPAVRQ
jgi:hypothetical protein